MTHEEQKRAQIERDAKVFALYEQLLEIEQRLIPTGLHVFGRPSAGGEKTDLLKMIASFDRPESGVRALPEAIIDEAIREFVTSGTDAAVQLLEQRAGVDPEAAGPVFLVTPNSLNQARNKQRDRFACARAAWRVYRTWTRG